MLPKTTLHSSVLLLLIALALLPSPCAAQQTVAEAIDAAKREYVIGPSDVLEIAVWNNTLISRTVPVSVTMPFR